MLLEIKYISPSQYVGIKPGELIVRVHVTVLLVPVTMLMDHVCLAVPMDGQGKPARKLFHKVSEYTLLIHCTESFRHSNVTYSIYVY